MAGIILHIVESLHYPEFVAVKYRTAYRFLPLYLLIFNAINGYLKTLYTFISTNIVELLLKRINLVKRIIIVSAEIY